MDFFWTQSPVQLEGSSKRLELHGAEVQKCRCLVAGINFVHNPFPHPRVADFLAGTKWCRLPEASRSEAGRGRNLGDLRVVHVQFPNAKRVARMAAVHSRGPGKRRARLCQVAAVEGANVKYVLSLSLSLSLSHLNTACAPYSWLQTGAFQSQKYVFRPSRGSRAFHVSCLSWKDKETGGKSKHTVLTTRLPIGFVSKRTSGAPQKHLENDGCPFGFPLNQPQNGDPSRDTAAQIGSEVRPTSFPEVRGAAVFLGT